MARNKFVISLALCLSFTACGKNEPQSDDANISASATQQVSVDVTAAYPSEVELAQTMSGLSYNQKNELQKLANIFVDAYGIQAAQELSNDFWAGTNGRNRNRAASAVLAVHAYNKSPERWSAMRTGIAYVNGLGVEKDGHKAVEVLNSNVLDDNMAAEYFLSKAYMLTGEPELARMHLENAANMGHKLAQKELGQ